MKRPILLLTSVSPALNGTRAVDGEGAEADCGAGNDRITFDPVLGPMNSREVENVS
jgi:hypothetical protein